MVRINKTAIWAILFAQLHIIRVLAAVSFTNNAYYIYDGIPFTITWTGNKGPVTVTLMSGPDENLQPVSVLVTGYEGQEYTWTPPPTLPADSYELQIEDAGSTDYSPRFRYPAPNVATTDSWSESTTTPTSSLSATATSTFTSKPTATPESETPSPDSGGLSTAAKAAIAALSSVLGVALIGFLTYCMVQRKRKHQNERDGLMVGYELPSSEHTSPATTATMMNMKGGGVGDGYGQGYVRAELPGGWARDPVEMSADGVRGGG